MPTSGLRITSLAARSGSSLLSQQPMSKPKLTRKRGALPTLEAVALTGLGPLPMESPPFDPFTCLSLSPFPFAWCLLLSQPPSTFSCPSIPFCFRQNRSGLGLSIPSYSTTEKVTSCPHCFHTGSLDPLQSLPCCLTGCCPPDLMRLWMAPAASKPSWKSLTS